MDIKRNDARSALPGASEAYTGTVSVERLFKPFGNADVTGEKVSFEPGARTVWHTHPVGQTLLVIEGAGRLQTEGDAMEKLDAGDVVQIAANEKHWHGANPDSKLVYIAIQEELGGKTVTWMNPVTDEEYKS